MSRPAPIEAALMLDSAEDKPASTDLYEYLSTSLDNREACPSARGQAVAERSSLISQRTRELAHAEALATAREGRLREREARFDTVHDRLRTGAARLEQRFGEHAGARQVLNRAAELDRVELDIVAREVALDTREAEWRSKVAGRPEDADPA